MPRDIDLIVLTFNEELNLSNCLNSVQGLPQNIFIVDSGSTDRTVEIAREYNAHVVVHEFATQAQQFNWALDNLPIKSEWVLRLDADEYLLPELRDEIARVLPGLPAGVTGLYLKRRMVFMERWIRHGGYYPTWMLRLFRYGKARSEHADLNEHVVLLEGTYRRLQNDFVDQDRKGLAAWTLKHEGFAVRQARFLNRLQHGYDPAWIPPALFGSQPQRKRWFLQNFYQHIPLFVRASLYFVYRYFLRLGFLDGREGLIFHFLHGCWYPFYTDVKIYEGIRRNYERRAQPSAPSGEAAIDQTYLGRAPAEHYQQGNRAYHLQAREDEGTLQRQGERRDAGVKIPLSVVVVTYNEEVNLPECLESLGGLNCEVFVVDSGSTDRTIEIAQRYTVDISYHSFETHTGQWQWALENLPYSHEWVFGLDADQRVTPELKEEVLRLFTVDQDRLAGVDGFYIKRRQIFRGHWIRHGGYYPKYLLKLFRRGKVLIDKHDLAQHHFYVAGEAVKLKHDVIEDNHKEHDIAVWIEKHSRYALLQAKEELLRSGRPMTWPIRPALFGNPDQRVIWQKQYWYRLPLYIRPLLYFVYRYFLNLGFLDGKQGLIFHFLQGFWYPFVTDIHLDNLRKLERQV